MMRSQQLTPARKSAAARPIALTADLVARVRVEIPDPGRDPALTYNTDDELAAMADTLIAEGGVTGDAWIFACGSLIWRPGCPVSGSMLATLHGWHRTFCLKITRFRATKDQPGLMMALDRGGRCNGVAYRLAAAEVKSSLVELLRREVSIRPSNNLARWVTLDTPEGKLKAVAFVIDPKGGNYVGRMDFDAQADLIAKACGHFGSCAEYLHNTVVHLAEFGIHDRNLWKLQQLVAKRIAATTLSGTGQP